MLIDTEHEIKKEVFEKTKVSFVYRRPDPLLANFAKRQDLTNSSHFPFIIIDITHV